MSIVIIDCETNGLPVDSDAPADEVDNWPRVVQLGWVVAAQTGAEVRAHSHLIRPDGWAINPECSAFHGITTEAAAADGVPIATVLDLLAEDLRHASLLVAHNLRFDARCIGAEYHRVGFGFDNPLSTMPGVCTMIWGMGLCKIPAKEPGDEYKWPSLGELVRHLFGVERTGAHDALCDARAAAQCFFRMCELANQGEDPGLVMTEIPLALPPAEGQ